MSNSMFDSGKGGIHINGGTFNDIGRDQHNTYNHTHEYGFKAGSNPHMHHYAPGTRVNHGSTTNISHAGNLNLGTNYGNLVQNSGGSYSSHGPPMGYYGGPPWGYPPHGMHYPPPPPPPWAQPPYSQPPTPNYGNRYPGNDDGYYQTNSFQSNNPYNSQGSNASSRRRGTNPFLNQNSDRTRSAPPQMDDDGLSYISEERSRGSPRSDPRRRNQPMQGVDEQMGNLKINDDRSRDSRSSSGRSSPRGQPQRRTRCETVPDDSDDEQELPSRASGFGLR